MIFGFSVGDFITAAQLATKIKRDFDKAPFQFKAISDDVRNLSIAFLDAGASFSEQDIGDDQRRNLDDIDQSCQNVLDELQRILDKNMELSPESGSAVKRTKRVWKRLKWDPEEIDKLRNQINTNISFLNTFSERVTQDNVIKLVRHQEDQNRQSISDWITPIDYFQQQNDFIARRQAGTGQWLLDSTEYQTWVDTKQQTLFCPGIPGAGKTILTSIVVEELSTRFQKDKGIGIAYLYCNYQRQNEQKVEELLASLLKQLTQAQSSLPNTVKNLHKRHQDKRTRPSLDEISGALQSVIRMYSKVFLIIDALDECQESYNCRNKFLSELFNLQAECGANLFVTSRSIPEITENFQRSISLEIRAKKGDVRRYVESYISCLPSFVKRSPELQEEVKTQIVTAVDGMFLLARLHLESLPGRRSPKELRTALRNLPSGPNAYDRAYEDVIKRIEGQVTSQAILAKQALLWVTCAERSLTILELRHALAVEVGEPKLDSDNLSDISDIVSVCAGLITIDEESNIVCLVHYTAQEYFNRTLEHWFTDPQTEIAQSCITYLSFSAFESGPCSTDEEFVARLDEKELYGYAAQNWGHHTRKALEMIQTDALTLRFLESESMGESASQAMLTIRHYYGRSQSVPKGVKALHLAAYFNLQNTIMELLQRGHNPAAADSDGQTPLMWAIDYGHDTLVELLLTKELDVNRSDKLRRTALHHAASIGSISSIHLLIQRQAEIEARDSQGQTPLLAAVSNVKMAAVESLLKFGADPKVFDEKRKGALHLSLENEHTNLEMVALLLAQGAPADMVDIDNMSPLHCTIRYGCRDIANQLLENGVSVDFGIERRTWTRSLREGFDAYELNAVNISQDRQICGLRGLTPLHFAALVGNAGMTEYLLSQGADPNALSHYQETPLHLALSMSIQGSKYEDAWNDRHWIKEVMWDIAEDEDGYCEVVCRIAVARRAVIEALLKDHRTDVTLQDAQGSSVLHLMYLEPGLILTASTQPHLAQNLIWKGAKPSARNLKGQTALHLASSVGDLESVEMLINEGSAIDVADNEGKSAIHYAMKSRQNIRVVKAILEANNGNAIDLLATKDNKGRTALHHSVRTVWSSVELVHMLLRLGASANETDNSGNSPLGHYLSEFIMSKDSKICLLLLQYGTNTTSVNKAGETLAELYTTHREVKAEILQLLNEYKLDIASTNSKGMTLLHKMALIGSLTEEALQYLLSSTNIQQNATDLSGRTALQYALEEAKREHDPRLFDSDRWSRTANILRQYAT